MLRRFGAGRALRNALRMRGGDPHGHGSAPKSWFSPGDNDPGGVLFNETPPPPGQSRKWEDWELPYYATGIIAFFMLYIGLNSKPDTRIETWARKVAIQRLEEEESQEQAEMAVQD